MMRQLTVPAPLRWAGLVLAWLVLLAMGSALLVALIVPRLAGATPYVIETGSMAPGMPPGTLVVVKPVPMEDVAVGEVMTYQLRSGDPTVVTHRVIEQGLDLTGEPRWRTQGDANDAPDESWVRPVQVKGVRWYSVPYLGYLTSFVTEQQRSALTVLVAVGLLGYAALMFGRAAFGRRKNRTQVPVEPSAAELPEPLARVDEPVEVSS